MKLEISTEDAVLILDALREARGGWDKTRGTLLEFGFANAAGKLDKRLAALRILAETLSKTLHNGIR